MQPDDATKSNPSQAGRVLWFRHLAVLLPLAVIFFAHIKIERSLSPYYELAAEKNHRAKQTAIELTIAENWYESSIADHQFVMIHLPDRPGYRGLKYRDPYIRIPFFAPVYTYLLAKWNGEPPSVGNVFTVAAWSRLKTALLIALIVWSVLSHHRVPVFLKLFSTTVAGLAFATNSIVLQNFTFDYFHTEAVIPCFVFSVWLAYLTRHSSRQIVMTILLAVSILFGCLHDWFMFVVAVQLVVLNWLFPSPNGRQYRVFSSAAILIAAGIAGLILLRQVWVVDGFDALAAKFMQRTGLQPVENAAELTMLKAFYHRAVGLQSSVILWIAFGSSLLLGMIVWLRRPATTSETRGGIYDLVFVTLLLLLPCFTHAHLLTEHYVKHQDNCLKFLAAESILFGLLPIWLLGLLAFFKVRIESSSGAWTPASSGVVASQITGIAVTFLLMIVFVFPRYADWRGYFESQTIDMEDPKMEATLGLRGLASDETIFVSRSLIIDRSYDDRNYLGTTRALVYDIEADADEVQRVIKACKAEGLSPRILYVIAKHLEPVSPEPDTEIKSMVLSNDRIKVFEIPKNQIPGGK